MPRELTQEIEDIRSVESVIDSATTFVNGEADRLAAARQDAIDKGASEEQLAAFDVEIAALKEHGAALASAIAANTPGAPTEV
ncbi:MAG: hypothetical protein ABI634_12870 [Acidobacteriota bacterium]